MGRTYADRGVDLEATHVRVLAPAVRQHPRGNTVHPGQVTTYEVTMDPDEVGGLKARKTDVAPTLTTIQEGKKTDRGVRVVTSAVSVAENQRGELVENDTAGALARAGGKPGQGRPTTRTASGVRRLTPVECERLQGFPDAWTLVEGVKCTDSRRYAAMGNAVTVNVAEWIGRRIMAEEQATATETA
jgi:DNA (cytosine-5)-methyltransferase 1